MNLDVLAAGLGYLGSALGVAMVIPQIVRTLRNPALTGVSALSWALTASACTTWLLYGVRTGEIPQIPGNVLLVSGAVLIVLVVPSTTRVRTRGAGLALAGLLLGGLAAVAPPALIGAVAFGIGFVSAAPQTVRSLRRGAGTSSAVSLLTWVLRVASQASWLSYALLVHDLTVTASAIFLLSNALLIVGIETARQPASPAARRAAATTALSPVAQATSQ